MLGTCEALKSDASEIAAFASQPLCINYQLSSRASLPVAAWIGCTVLE